MTGSSLPRRASSVRSASVALEGLVFIFRILVRHAVRPANIHKGSQKPVASYSVFAEQPGHSAISLLGRRKEDVLRAEVFVLQALGSFQARLSKLLRRPLMYTCPLPAPLTLGMRSISDSKAEAMRAGLTPIF